MAGGKEVTSSPAQNPDDPPHFFRHLGGCGPGEKSLGIDRPVKREGRTVFLFETVRIHIPGTDLDRIDYLHPQVHIIIQEGVGRPASMDAELGPGVFLDGPENPAVAGFDKFCL